MKLILLHIQVDSAVVVLAEEAGNIDKSHASSVKKSQKTDSYSGKSVLQKAELQLENLQKKIRDVNSNVQKYVLFLQ